MNSLAFVLNESKVSFRNAKQDVRKTQDTIIALGAIITCLQESHHKLKKENKTFHMANEMLSKKPKQLLLGLSQQKQENIATSSQDAASSCHGG